MGTHVYSVDNVDGYLQARIKCSATMGGDVADQASENEMKPCGGVHAVSQCASARSLR